MNPALWRTDADVNPPSYSNELIISDC